MASYDSTSPIAAAPNSSSNGTSSEDIMHSFVASSDSSTSINSSDCILGSNSREGIINTASPNIQVEIEAISRMKHGGQTKSDEARHMWKIFLSGINPINTEEWGDLGLHWKIYEAFKVRSCLEFECQWGLYQKIIYMSCNRDLLKK